MLSTFNIQPMRHIAFLPLASLLLVLLSCRPEAPVVPTATRYLAAEAPLPGLDLDLRLWADDSLMTGYNALYLEVAAPDQGRPLTGWEFTVKPVMHMPSMSHSAPLEPAGPANAEGLYPLAVVFTMPSDGMSYWEMEIAANNPATGETASLILPIVVHQPGEARMRSLIAADDSSKLFLSLVAPQAPAVGINDFELTVHRKASMMAFPAVTDLRLEIEPTMPSMGHGSPHNVHPVHVAEGHYRGQVNFTMDGWWAVQVRAYRSDVLIGETVFNLTFQVR